MSLLSDLLSRNIVSVNKSQLEGATKLKLGAFQNCTKLLSIELPDTIETIESYAFTNCTSLKKFTLGENYIKSWTAVGGLPESVSEVKIEDINPYSNLSYLLFSNTNWYKAFLDDEMICVAKGQILIGNKISKPSTGFNIPSTVINLADYSCQKYGDTADSNFISFAIPDTVEIIGGSVFNAQPLKTIIVPASVKEIRGILTCGTTTTTLIFRQPEDMYIKLPTPGQNSGIAGNKTSRSMDIYTDNKMLKAYNWAKDNVTATIHPLSEAPA